MLILSRKEKERIKLGDSIIVTVVRVSGDKVRLGIEAPADLLVLRDELEPFTPEQAAAAKAQRAATANGVGGAESLPLPAAASRWTARSA